MFSLVKADTVVIVKSFKIESMYFMKKLLIYLTAKKEADDTFHIVLLTSQGQLVSFFFNWGINTNKFVKILPQPTTFSLQICHWTCLTYQPNNKTTRWSRPPSRRRRQRPPVPRQISHFYRQLRTFPNWSQQNVRNPILA